MRLRQVFQTSSGYTRAAVAVAAVSLTHGIYRAFDGAATTSAWFEKATGMTMPDEAVDIPFGLALLTAAIWHYKTIDQPTAEQRNPPSGP